MADNAFTRFTNRLIDVSNINDDEVRRNQEMADMLLTQSSQPRPLQHWTQGLAQLANAMNAQIYRQRASKGEAALKEQKARQMGDFLANLNLDDSGKALLQNAPEGIQPELMAAVAGNQLLPKPEQKPKVSNGKQRVVSIPGQKPFEAEVYETIDPATNMPIPFIMRDGQQIRLNSDWLTTPTERTQQIPYDDKRINTAALESYNSSLSLVRNLTATTPEIAANPGSIGTRGAVGLGVGGAVSVLWGPEAGDQVSRWIADNDIEKLGAVKARMQTLRSALVPILTGETSGRFSEPEREIASRAAGIIDKMETLADYGRGATEVIGAMKELTVASLENAYEQARRAPGVVNVPFDLNTEDGQVALLTALYEGGLDQDQRVRALKRLSRIQNSAY